MNKKVSLIISLALSFVVFVAGFTTFAKELSPNSEGIVERSVLSSANTRVVLDSTKYVFDGKEKRPAVSVAYTDENGAVKALGKDKDYFVSYKNNINPGKASVTVSGANDYTGDITSYFTIVPAPLGTVKVDKTTLSSIKVSWTAQKGVSGYEAKIAAFGKKYKTYTVSAKKSAYTFNKLKYETKYKVLIRSFVTIDGKRVYGKFSPLLKTSTKRAVAAPNVNGYCSLLSVPVVEWKESKGADKYIVYRSDKKKGTYKKIAKTEGLSFQDKSAKLHKTYYYKVKAVKKSGDKTYYSQFSPAEKIKAMKTVLVGDSVLEGVEYYKALPGATFVVKIGMGTYTFYESFYFKVNGRPATGCEKLLSYKPDRVFIMFGMNEAAYKNNKSILQYYQYALDDIKAERKNCEIILLPVSPTKANSGKSIPKKKRLDSFNSALKDFAKENKVAYYDYTKPFKDKNGNLLNAYDGGDGCHWKPSSCRLFVEQLNKYIKKH